MHTLDVLRRHDVGWLLAASYGGASVVRAETFDAVEISLACLWIDGPAALRQGSCEAP